jgi:hypothetical protein
MERLSLAIQRGEIRFPEGPIVTELEAFEYQYTRTGVRYGAPEGMHDDCVCALALAVYAMPTRMTTKNRPSGPPPRESPWRGMGGTTGSKWR